MDRLVARTALAAALLIVGFGGLLAGAYGVRELAGTIPSERAREVQAGLLAAFVVVTVKGLLPQLVGTSALLSIVRRWVAHIAADGSFARTAGVVVVCAALAYGVVAPLLLTVDHAPLPGLHPRDPAQHFYNFLVCTGAVTAALLVSRAWLRSRRDGVREGA